MSRLTRFLGAIDPLARRLGFYTAYTLDWSEFLGSVAFPLGLHDARDYLEANDYRPHVFSAAKRHPESGALHDLSYRYVPDEHPIEAEGTRLAEYAPGACQYHVHVWATSNGVDFFSHYELRPFTAPREHYRPEYGETYIQGVTDLQL